VSLLRRYFPRTYLAQRNLYRGRARTILAIVTVAIGVLAIGGLGLFGLAFEADQQETLGDLATEVRVEGPVQTGLAGENAPSLDQRRVDTVREIAGEYDATVTVFRDGSFPDFEGEVEYNPPDRAIGVSDPGPVYDEYVQEGEIPDELNRGAIITERLNRIRDRSPSLQPLEIGDPVTIGGQLQRIVAIIEDPGGAGSIGTRPIETVGFSALLPMELVEPRSEDQPYSGILITTKTTSQAGELSTRIEAALNEPLREDQPEFSVESVKEEAETVEQQFTSTDRFLVAVGSISLLIAGISITNVQLMSARERRQEIGVLRAVGYGRLDILAIMLIEAVIMGLIAAAVGLGLTVGAGAVINDVFLDDPTAFQPETVRYLAGGFSFGVAICVVAGIYPAWRASRNRPVETLEG